MNSKRLRSPIDGRISKPLFWFDSASNGVQGMTNSSSLSSQVRTIADFHHAFAQGDIAAAMNYCTDDVVWDNVPMKPIVGKQAVQGFLEKFARGMSEPRYERTHVLEQDNLVMVEGVENYQKNGKSVRVPYMAAFEFRDGRICQWRDYFDLATVERQLAG